MLRKAHVCRTTAGPGSHAHPASLARLLEASSPTCPPEALQVLSIRGLTAPHRQGQSTATPPALGLSRWGGSKEGSGYLPCLHEEQRVLCKRAVAETGPAAVLTPAPAHLELGGWGQASPAPGAAPAESGFSQALSFDPEHLSPSSELAQFKVGLNRELQPGGRVQRTCTTKPGTVCWTAGLTPSSPETHGTGVEWEHTPCTAAPGRARSRQPRRQHPPLPGEQGTHRGLHVPASAEVLTARAGPERQHADSAGQLSGLQARQGDHVAARSLALPRHFTKLLPISCCWTGVSGQRIAGSGRQNGAQMGGGAGAAVGGLSFITGGRSPSVCARTPCTPQITPQMATPVCPTPGEGERWGGPQGEAVGSVRSSLRPGGGRQRGKGGLGGGLGSPQPAAGSVHLPFMVQLDKDTREIKGNRSEGACGLRQAHWVGRGWR